MAVSDELTRLAARVKEAQDHAAAAQTRTKAEVEEWKKRCPIETFTQKLKSERLLGDADLEEIEGDVAREIKEAVAFAEA
jgi:TPP-dependent pyruvate/acetoin dehydrogenase alpha subunit